MTLFNEIKYVNQTLIHIASPLKDTQWVSPSIDNMPFRNIAPPEEGPTSGSAITVPVVDYS